jgi:hypothetical protein
MISHSRAELLLAESIDFDLAAGPAREVAEHLASCPACAAYAAALRADAQRVRQMPRHHAPPRVRAALEQAADRRGRPASGRLQLLLAAALLLGLLLGAALLVGSRMQGPEELLPLWAAAPVGAGVAGAPGARMEAVAWGEEGFVAVGASPEGPASWYSSDGDSWTRGDTSDLVAGLSLTDVVSFEGGYAALGIADGRTTICESPDGRGWTCSQPSALDGPGRAIASHDGELVVVGGRTDIGGAVWYRPRDAAWREAAIRPNISDELGAVGWTANGFVAAGAEIYSSVDGRSWTLHPSARTMVASDLVEGPARLVIVGTGSGRPQALAGTGVVDLLLAPAPAASGAMFGVVYASGRFIAVGDGPGGAMAWTSSDGLTWAAEAVAGEAGSRMVDVATDSERVVAVGSRGTEAAGWRYGERK